jgi:hypothetical protein
MSTDTDELRRFHMLEWTQAAHAVVTKTNDQTAKAIYDFMRQNMILVGVKGHGIVAIDASNKKNWIAFLPLIAGDEAESIGWKRHLDEPCAAAFLPESRTLIVKALFSYTPIWKGVLLLHEAFHALRYGAKAYDTSNRIIYTQKESEVHRFQNKLFETLGGTLYEEAIKDGRRKLKSLRSGTTPLKGEACCQALGYPKIFHTIFGNPQSESEWGMRAAHYYIHCGFELMEELFPANSFKAQAEFLAELYYPDPA